MKKPHPADKSLNSHWDEGIKQKFNLVKLMKMRKLVYLICAFAILACSKEEVQKEMLATNEIVFDNIPRIENPYDVNSYITNQVDPDDEKINRQLIEIAKATLNLQLEINLTQIVFEKANNSFALCADLKELSDMPSLKSTSEAYSVFKNSILNTELTHKSTNPQNIGTIEKYIPAIFVPNLETADPSKQPLICPGFEVDDGIDGMEEYEGYIVAWYYDENNELNEILLNEEMAMNTSHPVFIIDNAENDMVKLQKKQMDFAPPASQLKSATAQTAYSSKEFQINYRYDKTNNSEFCVVAAHIDEDGGVHNILYDGGYRSWKEIAEVHKDDIGEVHGRWEQFCSIEVEPFSDNYTFLEFI